MDARLIALGTNGVWRLLIAAIVALAVIVTLAAIPASAATSEACRVTNKSTGAKYTQLKAAVKAARSGHNLDVKGICHGTATIGQDLTIKGVSAPASGRATLDGDRKGTTVTVARSTTVTIKSLTIQGSDRWGPGVSNEGSLTLSSVIVEGNKGGGVWNDGDLWLTARTRISDNTGDFGGGVWNDGALWLYGTSTVTGNTATDGGGVHNGSSLALYDSSSISGNTAENGGGVYAYLPDDLIGAVCGANVHSNAPDDCYLGEP